MGVDTSSQAVGPTLRVPPTALPSLIAAHDRAVTEMRQVLVNVSKAGRVPEPWTRDPVAQDIAGRFNVYAIDGEGSAYACLGLYEQRLRDVLETLRTMHAAYEAGEDVNAAAMGAL